MKHAAEKLFADRLEALYNLQVIDTNLDEIKKVLGALPEEIMDIEDEHIQYQNQEKEWIEKIQEIQNQIITYREGIKSSEKLIKKYEEQLMNIRNDREYSAIIKEIETQSLEIQICEKRIQEKYLSIEQIKQGLEKTENLIVACLERLKSKQDELYSIVAESESSETEWKQKRETAVKKVDAILLKAYDRIRNNTSNGLAIVNIIKGYCNGCFNMIPPQKRSEVREKKKMIICEHCGRIFYDDINSEEDASGEKPTRRKRKTIEKKEDNTIINLDE
ncbi:MAG: C4-type zinc ribbon domain-containing protein [Chitinophagaceae bacterium]|nr:C4-type zinc ribbon domain-containing protein [Chitinophagaceae bacterium]